MHRNTVLVFFLVLAAVFPVETEGEESRSYPVGQTSTQVNSKKSENLTQQANNRVNSQKAEKKAGLHPIQIIGPDDFIKKTEEALTLLKEKSPEHYELVTNYLSVIEFSEKRDVPVPSTTSVITSKLFRNHLKYYALGFVYEAYQSKLYEDYRQKFSLPVPFEAYANRDAENACLNVEKNCAKNIGMHISYLECLDRMIEDEGIFRISPSRNRLFLGTEKSKNPQESRETNKKRISQLAKHNIDPKNFKTVDGRAGLHPIKIIGTDDFIKKTEEALTLLKEKSPDHYTIVTNYLSVIQFSEKTGVTASSKISKIGFKIFKLPLQWYAAGLAHESYHSKLYHDYRQKFGLPVPNDVYSGRKAEDACLDVQKDCAKNLGAHISYIKYLEDMKKVDYFSKDVERTW